MAMTRQDAASRLYGAKANAAGSIDSAIRAYHDRWLARRPGDKDARRTADQERAQLTAFATRRGITPAALAEALNVLHERESFPNSPQSIDARRERTREALRLERGGAQEAHAHLQRYLTLTQDLAKSVPTLATRANATGAGEDLRIINALAEFGDQPKEQPK